VAKVTGFLEYAVAKQPYRPATERVGDWRQVMEKWESDTLNRQAARCMDCGVPFCHQGCPLGNLIPDWNDLVWRERWRDAIERLHATNNFPEFTGTACPAPCEGSCVLGINNNPVTIKAIELAIVERAFAEGWIQPRPPAIETGKRVAVIGSGPAGLAAAQQLRRAGHLVSVFERADRMGGLLRYGIPEFKLEKRIVERRLRQMAAEGVVFQPGVEAGVDVSGAELRSKFDAILLAGGATVPRDLNVPGRDFAGVHFAMDYLTQQNRRCEGEAIDAAATIDAANKRVVVIGGGDTGADCLGTAHRQGAKAVYQLEILPEPPKLRAADNPWPEWPKVFRVSSAHEEGGERYFAASTKEFLADAKGRVRALRLVRVEQRMVDGRPTFAEVLGSEQELPCDLAFLALGFTGPGNGPLLQQLGVKRSEQGNVGRDRNWMTNVAGIFTAGDMQRGQSLIVWAIAEGRSAARAIDQYLMGHSDLPAPLA
jgi:glutamate synthase (NADPH/NADH) small chain